MNGNANTTGALFISTHDHDLVEGNPLDRFVREQITDKVFVERTRTSIKMNDALDSFQERLESIFYLYARIYDPLDVERHVREMLSVFSDIFSNRDIFRIYVKETASKSRYVVVSYAYRTSDLYEDLRAADTLGHLNAIIEMSGGMPFVHNSSKYLVPSYGLNLKIDRERVHWDIMEWRETYYPIYVQTLESGVPVEDIVA